MVPYYSEADLIWRGSPFKNVKSFYKIKNKTVKFMKHKALRYMYLSRPIHSQVEIIWPDRSVKKQKLQESISPVQARYRWRESDASRGCHTPRSVGPGRWRGGAPGRTRWSCGWRRATPAPPHSLSWRAGRWRGSPPPVPLKKIPLLKRNTI